MRQSQNLDLRVIGELLAPASKLSSRKAGPMLKITAFVFVLVSLVEWLNHHLLLTPRGVQVKGSLRSNGS